MPSGEAECAHMLPAGTTRLLTMGSDTGGSWNDGTGHGVTLHRAWLHIPTQPFIKHLLQTHLFINVDKCIKEWLHSHIWKSYCKTSFKTELIRSISNIEEDGSYFLPEEAFMFRLESSSIFLIFSFSQAL